MNLLRTFLVCAVFLLLFIVCMIVAIVGEVARTYGSHSTGFLLWSLSIVSFLFLFTELVGTLKDIWR